MDTLFYNIVSLVLGVLIFSYGISSYLKRRKPLLLALALIHGIALIACGIVGFIINKYTFIIIIVMFVFTISYVLILVFLDQRNGYKKNEPKEKKIEKDKE